MSRRPLLVTDCDEVLLHMVVPFAQWVDEAHHVHFDLDSGDFVNALRHKVSGVALGHEEIWPLLRGFFATEMHRQYPIEGAIESVQALAEQADVVVLTNLHDHERDGRIDQLRAVGVEFPVFTNQGGKGPLLKQIIADYNPSVTVFVDDLGHNHASVAEHVPDVWRLHMVGEPRLAPRIMTHATAHARIDDWVTARHWIAEKFEGGLPYGQ
ncbi:MAG: hypothetical protein RLZZ561_397 [Pseudomonadota bacterium]